MKLYQNPPLIIRLSAITVGLFLCILAGVGGSIFWLGIGLGIGIFACAWGDREYIVLLRRGVMAVKEWVMGVVKRR